MEKDPEFWNQFFGFHKAVTLFVKKKHEIKKK